MNIFKNIIQKYEMVKCNRKATSNKLTVRFKNNTTGINISIDDRDGRLDILICKIVDNNFPTYKFGTNSNEVFDVTINDYVFVKTGILFKPNQDLVSELKQSVALIEQYGAPLLSGDFSSFVEIRKIYEQRIQQFEAAEKLKNK